VSLGFLYEYLFLRFVLFGKLVADIRGKRPRVYAVSCQSAIDLDMKNEVLRGPLCPQVRIAFRRDRVIGGIDLDRIESAGIEL